MGTLTLMGWEGGLSGGGADDWDGEGVTEGGAMARDFYVKFRRIS